MYLYESGDNLFKGHIWIPQRHQGNVMDDINSLEGTNQNFIKPDFKKVDKEDVPKTWVVPTFFDNGSLTMPFQTIVNLYGIPRYKEINAALFTVASFPYLFGVMFGDMGHGGVLFVLGIIWMCMASKFEKDPSFGAQVLYNVRYFVALCGFFSMYVGAIYNEFFAINVPLFSSCYDIFKNPADMPEPNNAQRGLNENNLIGPQREGCVYPFGIDWVWTYSESSKLTMLNGYKMKGALLIGMIHMVFGMLLKICNNIYFGDIMHLILDTIPQIIFYVSFFGLMGYAIVYKWTRDFTDKIRCWPSHAEGVIPG